LMPPMCPSASGCRDAAAGVRRRIIKDCGTQIRSCRGKMRLLLPVPWKFSR
jgi:hypothetical protein